MADNYLDDKQTYLDNSVIGIAELGEVFVASVAVGEPLMEDAYEILTLDIMQAQVVTGTETEQLNALTVLVDTLGLNNLPGPMIYSTPASYMPALTAITGLILAGLNISFTGTGTANDPYVVNANVPSYEDPTFASITGSPNDNTALAAALAAKQALITAGSSGQFYGWDKTMRQILFSQLGSVPTTLVGYGISQGDTLFNGKYIQPSGAITGYSLGANRILAATDTWLQSLGILQRQISNRQLYFGLPPVNARLPLLNTDGTVVWVEFGAASNITGLISAGTNVTITGTGTSGDPYVINASGGGGSSDLADTLLVGNTTGGTDIAVSDGDAITFEATGQPDGAISYNGAFQIDRPVSVTTDDGAGATGSYSLDQAFQYAGAVAGDHSEIFAIGNGEAGFRFQTSDGVDSQDVKLLPDGFNVPLNYQPGQTFTQPYEIINKEYADALTPPSYLTLDLATWTALVGANGLIPGWRYRVTSAFEFDVFGFKDIVVTADTVNTIETTAYVLFGDFYVPYTVDSTLSNPGFFLNSILSMALTGTQALGYVSGYNWKFNQGLTIFLTDGSLFFEAQIQGSDSNAIIFDNVKALDSNGTDWSAGDFGSYDPNTDTFTPYANPWNPAFTTDGTVVTSVTAVVQASYSIVNNVLNYSILFSEVVADFSAGMVGFIQIASTEFPIEPTGGHVVSGGFDEYFPVGIKATDGAPALRINLQDKTSTVVTNNYLSITGQCQL